MVSIPWSRRIKWFASRPLLVLAVLVLGRDGAPKAAACGWTETEMAELTTFDPSVTGERTDMSLAYDINTLSVGARCEACEQRARREDWNGYFGGQLDAANWELLLLNANVADVNTLEASLASGHPPERLRPIFESVQRQPQLRTRVARALAYVKLARAVENVASLAAAPSAPPPQPLQKSLRRAAAVALAEKDPFMLQRYSFLRLRVTFYERRWADVKQMVAAMPELKVPSDDLAWRARHYLAGALRRTGDVADANLELARIYAGSDVLRGRAASDFQPQEDADWEAALQRAGNARTQALLWHMVGLKFDGVAAAQAIFKLDPTSKLLALLVVRELAKLEASDPDPAKHNAVLEKLVATVARTPGADRPWVMSLVGGHLAAQRGDVETARHRLGEALAARPDDQKLRNQARASLALGLARQGKTDPASLKELAHTMLSQDVDFRNFVAVNQQVRGSLAAAMARSGRVIEAEFLQPGASRTPSSSWQDPRFLQLMLARTKQTNSEFDRFLLASAYTRQSLELELALNLLFHDQFAAAKPWLSRQAATTLELNADPFVTHIKDCFDCDFGSRRADGKVWTLPALLERLNRLRVRANQTGDTAARASLELGTALYNLTLMGNARSLARDTRQATHDTSAALH